MEELIQRRQELIDEMYALAEQAAAESRSLTEEEQATYDGNESEVGTIDETMERQAKLDALAAAQPAPIVTRTEPAVAEAPMVNRNRVDEADFDKLVRGGLNESETRDAAKAVIETIDTRYGLDVSKADRLIRSGGQHGTAIAHHVATFGQDVYAQAWAKRMTGRDYMLSPEEARALAVGTGTSAGNMVPTHLDPTLILTNAGVTSDIRRISRNVTLPSPGPNTWNGLTSAGVTAAFGAEASAYSESTGPVNVAPAIPTFKLKLHTRASEEALEDVAGLGTTILELFADAKDRHEALQFIQGDGTTEPQGIEVALDANTNVEVSNTTAATLGLVDLHAALNGLSPRFRDRSTWLMSNTQLGTIQQLGTAVSASFSTDITQNYTNQLLGRPVALASDMPGTPSSTTQVENWLIVGDFQQYTIVDKIGFRVQFYPVAVDGDGLPTGQAGWLGHARVGAEPTYSGDATTTRAFVLLQDITSA